MNYSTASHFVPIRETVFFSRVLAILLLAPAETQKSTQHMVLAHWAILRRAEANGPVELWIPAGLRLGQEPWERLLCERFWSNSQAHPQRRPAPGRRGEANIPSLAKYKQDNELHREGALWGRAKRRRVRSSSPLTSWSLPRPTVFIPLPYPPRRRDYRWYCWVFLFSVCFVVLVAFSQKELIGHLSFFQKNQVYILARLKHENVIKMHEFFQDDPKHFYIVLELMRGGELFKQIPNRVSYVLWCFWTWVAYARRFVETSILSSSVLVLAGCPIA